MEQVVLTVILAGAITLFVTQLVRIEVTALLIIFTLAATGLLTPGEAFSGLSNPATVTVGAMFILSAGLVKTGVLDYVSDRLGDLVGARRRRLALVLGALVAVFSAFVNNTPVVVMMIPVVMTLCRRFDFAPSKLLIPLSYFSILGGTCTLLGTSTNILVHSLHREAGGAGFRMFDFLPLGLAYLAVGGLYLMLFGDRLLPTRASLAHLLDRPDPEGFVTEVSVGAASRLVGMTLEQLTGDARSSLRVLELIRDEAVVLAPPPGCTIEEDDTLLIRASASEIHTLLSRKGIEPGSAVADAERVSVSESEQTMAEAVIVPGSRFVNRELQRLGLNRDLGVKVLAVRRLGRHHVRRLRRMRLRVGDVLLVQGDQRALAALRASGDSLLVEGVHGAIRFPRRAPMALALMAAVVVLAALDVLPIALLALGGATAMILTRCISTTEALRSLDGQVLLLLAGTIPLGLAMQKTGMATDVAHAVLGVVGGWGPFFIVSGLYLLTSIFTEFLSNNAAAVLLTPIALGIAAAAGVDARPLLVAITFGASASFATPIGYQTNTLVMGPGGYLFRDFLRIGLPLNILLWLAASLLIPVLFPLYP